MATPREINEVKQLFEDRQKEHVKNKEKINNKYKNQFDNLDPTTPEMWLEMWDSYNCPYMNGMTKNEIKKKICDTTELTQENAKKAVDIAIEIDILMEITKPNQLEYMPAIPRMKPELYLAKVESYVDVDIWADFWDAQSFSKISVIDNERFDDACKEFFDEYDKNEITAIKELGLVSNIISKSDGGMIFVGVREE